MIKGVAQNRGKLVACRNRKSRLTFLRHAVTAWHLEQARCLLEAVSCRKHAPKSFPRLESKRCLFIHDMFAAGNCRKETLPERDIAGKSPPAGDWASACKGRPARHRGCMSHPDLQQEQPIDRREDGKKNCARPDHIGEEARHFHAGAPRHGINHEIRRIAYIGIGSHEHRAE
jgi:hypothetical protein